MTTNTITDIAAKLAQNIAVVEIFEDVWVFHTPRYNASFVSTIKALPYKDRRWDSEQRAWRVRNGSGQLALQAFKRIWPDAQEHGDAVHPLPANQVSAKSASGPKNQGALKGSNLANIAGASAKEYPGWSDAVKIDGKLGDAIDVDEVIAIARQNVDKAIETVTGSPARPYEGRICAEDLIDEPVAPATVTHEGHEAAVAVLGPCRKALVEAGGDITVELRTLGFENGAASPNLDTEFRAVTDANTGRVFNIVSDIWNTPQHRDVADMLDSVASEIDGFDVKCHAANHGGHVWWAGQVKHFEHDEILSDDVIERVTANMPKYGRRVSAGGALLPKGLDFSVKLMASHSVDGGSLQWSYLMDVEACTNKSRVTLAGFTGSLKHTTNIAKRVEGLTKLFAAAEGKALSLRDMVAKLSLVQVDNDTLDELIEKLVPNESARGLGQRKRLREIYNDAPGAAPNTAWGLYQMTTYFSTHEKSVSVGGRNGRKFSLDLTNSQKVEVGRYEQAMFGSGHTMNDTALRFALSLDA